jgi:hypothetical protein
MDPLFLPGIPPNRHTPWVDPLPSRQVPPAPAQPQLTAPDLVPALTSFKLDDPERAAMRRKLMAAWERTDPTWRNEAIYALEAEHLLPAGHYDSLFIEAMMDLARGIGVTDPTSARPGWIARRLGNYGDSGQLSAEQRDAVINLMAALVEAGALLRLVKRPMPQLRELLGALVGLRPAPDTHAAALARIGSALTLSFGFDREKLVRYVATVEQRTPALAGPLAAVFANASKRDANQTALWSALGLVRHGDDPAEALQFLTACGIDGRSPEAAARIAALTAPKD